VEGLSGVRDLDTHGAHSEAVIADELVGLSLVEGRVGHIGACIITRDAVGCGDDELDVVRLEHEGHVVLVARRHVRLRDLAETQGPGETPGHIGRIGGPELNVMELLYFEPM
jgi:hypothetical protein